jgi:hypothetical protein
MRGPNAARRGLGFDHGAEVVATPDALLLRVQVEYVFGSHLFVMRL